MVSVCFVTAFIDSRLWWRHCWNNNTKACHVKVEKQFRKFRANWSRMGISCHGLACVYVGTHHWCQMCISTCLLGTMWKRVPEGAVTDTYPTPPSLPSPTSPSTPAVESTRPLLLPLPNPTLFPHWWEDNVKQTSTWSITRACLPTCTPQETPFRLAD